MNSIGSFHGKLVEDMDKAELLEVIRYLSGQLQRNTAPNHIRANALGRVEMLKRGERRVS